MPGTVSYVPIRIAKRLFGQCQRLEQLLIIIVKTEIPELKDILMH